MNIEGNANYNVDDIQKLVIESHKQLVARFVLPVMTAASIFFYIFYFRPEKEVIGAIAFLIFDVIANILFTSRHWRFKIFGNFYFDSRYDLFDSLRWTFNLAVADVITMIVLRPSFSVFTVTWTILAICAHADTFARSHRYFVSAVALITYVLLATLFFKWNNYGELGFIVGGMVACLFIFAMVENFWRQSLIDLKSMQIKESNALVEAEKLKMDAMLGAQSRHISHELNNMIMVIDASVNLMKRSLPPDNDSLRGRVAQVERAISYIRKINYLVMDNMRYRSAKRQQTFEELISDVELLMKKIVENGGVSWESHLDDGIKHRKFEERSGSTYLIIHNIVKNAAEAMMDHLTKEMRQGSKVKVSISGHGASSENEIGYATLIVEDNGTGIKPEALKAILAGAGQSTKDDGHGLGLAFVRSECNKNGFLFNGESTIGQGTKFMILIPMIIDQQENQTDTIAAVP